MPFPASFWLYFFLGSLLIIKMTNFLTMVMGNWKEEVRVCTILFLILLEKSQRLKENRFAAILKSSPSQDSNSACSDRMPRTALPLAPPLRPLNSFKTLGTTDFWWYASILSPELDHFCPEIILASRQEGGWMSSAHLYRVQENIFSKIQHYYDDHLHKGFWQLILGNNIGTFNA